MDVYPKDACIGFLKQHRVGVMSLAKDNLAYAVPLFYAFDGKTLYFMSHPGEKDLFIEACEQACFVVVEYKGDDDWKSVQATGPVEKVTLSDDAMHALDVMAKNPFPPEFGSTPKGVPKRSAEKMYLWMMEPEKISGRSSHTPKPAKA